MQVRFQQSVLAEVWLDAGREGQTFSYRADSTLALQSGDLVRVRLRGRPMHGLVVAIVPRELFSEEQTVIFQPVEAVLQRSAVDPDWRRWIEDTARRCHLSPFRMLKAALPPGWLGQVRGRGGVGGRLFWWVQCLEPPADPQSLSSRQQALISWLNDRGRGIWQRELVAAGFSVDIVTRLESRGWLRRERRRPDAQGTASPQMLEAPQILTDDQASVIELFKALSSGQGLLLWGITGSGKTEVYLQLAAAELEAGRHVLLLTPEIGLIPQLVDRCRRRFGQRVLEYHSGCSDAEKLNVWRRCLDPDQPLLVVGTRSAVFVPLLNIGLIVLDEEHDSSYKQESPMPCYHARDLAMDRMQRVGGRVVLGSATPSLDSWMQQRPNGPLTLARLACRISSQPLPPVHVVDMRHELAEGHRRLISRPLMERLASCLIVESRRCCWCPVGTARSRCRSCGEGAVPHCDVADGAPRSGGGCATGAITALRWRPVAPIAAPRHSNLSRRDNGCWSRCPRN